MSPCVAKCVLLGRLPERVGPRLSLRALVHRTLRSTRVRRLHARSVLASLRGRSGVDLVAGLRVTAGRGLILASNQECEDNQLVPIELGKQELGLPAASVASHLG